MPNCRRRAQGSGAARSFNTQRFFEIVVSGASLAFEVGDRAEGGTSHEVGSDILPDWLGPLLISQSVMLRLPLERKRFPQSVELPSWRLAPIKDHLYEIGSQQSESQHVGNI